MALPDTTAIAAALLVKATVLAARWAGATRRHAITAMTSNFEHDPETEIALLRDRVEQLELQVAILRKYVGKHMRSPRYTLVERLHVLWFVEYFQIPRRRVSDYFGIARSTFYRWLHRVRDAPASPAPPSTAGCTVYETLSPHHAYRTIAPPPTSRRWFGLEGRPRQ